MMMATDECGRVLTAAKPRGRGIRKFGLVRVTPPPPPLHLPEGNDRDRNFVNDIQQVAKEEVPKEHVPAKEEVPKEHVPAKEEVPKEHVPAKEEVPKAPVPAKKAVASRRSGESPSSKSSSSASSPKPLKTPASFLNEICTKSGAKCTFQFENVGNPSTSGYFKCTVLVTAKNGNVVEGSAFGTNKQVAKQEAARNLLLNLDPQTDRFLTPKDPFKKEVVQERQGQLEKETKRSQKIPEVLVEKGEEGSGTDDNEPTDPGIDWDQNVIYMRSADGTITLAIPRQLAIQQLSPYQIQPQLSLDAKVNIVRDWNGPKIQRLKGMNPDKISQLKKPSDVAEKISESEGLSLNYLIIKLAGEDGGAHGENRYHCILEAKDSTMSYFTHSGLGESHEEAMNKAALNYIQMLWSIISAV